MWLPTPTDGAVREFQKLFKLELGLDLSLSEARVAATRLLHLHFYKLYGTSYLKEQINRKNQKPLDAAPPNE